MLNVVTTRQQVARVRKAAEAIGVAADQPVGVLGTEVIGIDTSAEKRDVKVVATTDFADVDDEVVIPSGADLGFIKKNRAVFIDHRTDLYHQCGVIRSFRQIWTDDRHTGWGCTIRLLPNEKGQMALDMFQQTREAGGSLGVSIGFKILAAGPLTQDEQAIWPKASRAIRRWEWLELSVTPFPANVMAREVPEPEPVRAPRKIVLT